MDPVNRENQEGCMAAAGHPAEVLAVVVFEVCCRTLAALREGWEGSLPDVAVPDPEFDEQLAFLSRSSGAARGGSPLAMLPACPGWRTLVEQNNLQDVVKERRPELGEEQRNRLIKAFYQALSRYRNADADDPGGAPPPPLLLAEPTGCGKSLLVSTACRLAGLPFLHIDTSQMVPEGIVGRSVNDIGGVPDCCQRMIRRDQVKGT